MREEGEQRVKKEREEGVGAWEPGETWVQWVQWVVDAVGGCSGWMPCGTTEDLVRPLGVCGLFGVLILGSPVGEN